MANQSFSFGFGAPQNTSASTQAVGNASTNTFGQLMKARNAYANQGLPNVSMGTKATQPGGLGTTQTNTLPSTYTAPKSQQTATYNAQNSGAGTAPTGTTSPFQVNPSTIPAPQQQAGSSSPANPIYPTATNSTVGIGGTPTGTMGGTTGQLIQSSLTGSPAAQGYTQQTGQYGAGNIPIGQSAADIAQQYGQKISNLENTRAGVMSGLLTTGTAPVAGGAAAIAGQTYGNLIQGQAAAEQAALQGTQQQLTAQNQAATAANEAAGQSVQQQQLQQQGLQQGATLQAPGITTQQVGQGTTVLNSEGQPVATTPVIAPVGSQTSYGVSPTTFGAGGQATTYQSGTQTGGQNTPFTAGQVSGQAQAGQQWVQNNATIGKAQGIQEKINQEITQNGINSLSSLQIANQANDYIKGQLSDPNLKNFFDDLVDYTQTLSPMIGIGGSSTDAKDYLSSTLVPQFASGTSIMKIMDNLNSLATNSNNALRDAGQGQTPPGVNAPQTNSSQNTQTTVPGMSGSYVKNAQGQWVKA